MLKKKKWRIGFINSFIFNNSRINEFSKSAELRLDNEMRMDKIKEKILELSKEIEGMNLLDEDSPLKDPLQYFKDKDKEKKEKEKKDESKDKAKIDPKFNVIQQKYKNVSINDAYIICSYTCESQEEKFSPYKILNQNLVSNNRKQGIGNI